MRALAIVTLALLALTLIAIPITQRHVDPGSIGEKPPLGLDSLYLVALSSVGELNLEKANEILGAIEESSIPANLRYVAGRVNVLLNDIMGALNDTRSSLEDARSLVDKGDYLGAESSLSRAEVRLGDARVAYESLVEASSRVGVLGVRVTLFQRELSKINSLINNLSMEIEALRDELREVSSRALETRILVQVNTSRVTVLENVEVTGTLESLEGPLANRSVVVHVGSSVVRTTTDYNGFFKVVARVADYVDKVRVYAEYVPVGGDKYRYRYSRSNEVTLEVFYVKPRLEIEPMEVKVKPLDKVTLTVKTEPHVAIVVSSKLVNTTMSSNNMGVALLELTVDPSVGDGVYPLTFSVKPRDLVGPAKATARVIVERDKPTITVDKPSYVIAGVPFEVTVRANTTSFVIACAEGVICSSGLGEVAKLKLRVPLSYLASSIRLHVRVEPQNPGYKLVEEVWEIRVFNPLVAILAFGVVGVLAVPLALRLRAREVIKVEEPIKPPGVTPTKTVEDPLLELAEIAGKLYGVTLRGSDTLREYLYKLRVLPRHVYEILEQALLAFERALYGKPEFSQQLRLKALELLKKAIEILRGAMV